MTIMAPAILRRNVSIGTIIYDEQKSRTMMTKWNAKRMEIPVHRLNELIRYITRQDELHEHMYIVKLLHTVYLKKFTALVHTAKFQSGTQNNVPFRGSSVVISENT